MDITVVTGIKVLGELN